MRSAAFFRMHTDLWNPLFLPCHLLCVCTKGSMGLDWFAITALKNPREYNLSTVCQGLFWVQRHVSK